MLRALPWEKWALAVIVSVQHILLRPSNHIVLGSELFIISSADGLFPLQVWKFRQASQRHNFGGFCIFVQPTHLGGCTAHVSLVSYLQGSYNEWAIYPNIKANDLPYSFMQPCLSCRKSNYESPMFYLWWFMCSAFVIHPNPFCFTCCSGSRQRGSFSSPFDVSCAQGS